MSGKRLTDVHEPEDLLGLVRLDSEPQTVQRCRELPERYAAHPHHPSSVSCHWNERGGRGKPVLSFCCTPLPL